MNSNLLLLNRINRLCLFPEIIIIIIIIKNSKRILFMVPELYWPCPKACVLYLSPQLNFVIVANGAYYVICPIF